MRKPLIGITSKYDYTQKSSILSVGYYRAIEKAGGIPIILPTPFSNNNLEDLLSNLDGILLSGGPDLDPKYFNEETFPENGEISPYRDEFEILLVKKAFEARLPLLGICRGLQVLNVALGGSLYQDIYSKKMSTTPDLLNTDIQIIHTPKLQHVQKSPHWYPCHNVTIKPDTLLYSIFTHNNISLRVDEPKTISVNSFHHQAIKGLAKDFLVSAQSSDGIIEAIEHKSLPFFVGIQWHPELMWETSCEMLELFNFLVINAK